MIQLPHSVLLQLDEFQDVAHSQYRLLHALTCSSSRQRVTIVGDGDQAIYDWRGADVLLFEVCCPLPPHPSPPFACHPPLPPAKPKAHVMLKRLAWGQLGQMGHVMSVSACVLQCYLLGLSALTFWSLAQTYLRSLTVPCVGLLASPWQATRCPVEYQI